MRDEGVFQDEIRLLLDCSKLLKNRLTDEKEDEKVIAAVMQCLQELDYVVGELMFAQDEDSFYEDPE